VILLLISYNLYRALRREYRVEGGPAALAMERRDTPSPPPAAREALHEGIPAFSARAAP